jgi:hypothetical protein
MANDVTGMFEVLDALESALKSAEPEKLEHLAKTLDAYSNDFPDEFFWAVGAQAPSLLAQLVTAIDMASRPDNKKSVRAIKLADRRPEGNA